MSKVKNNANKIIILKIVVLIVLAFLLGFSNTNGIMAKTAETRTYESEKILSQVYLDEEFDDSSVLVVMDKRTGGINKNHEDSFFGNFSKKAVYDLTYMYGGVKNRDNIDEENFNQILQIKLPKKSKQNVINVIRKLEKVEGILWAGPNHYDSPALRPPSATVPATGVHRYPLQWGLHGNLGIQAEETWNITTGIRNNVRVGVIDSGMDNHPDIAANRVNEGGDFVNMNDFNLNIPGPLRADPDGHGTHVSGTIGATGVNPNGVTGVAWNVSLIPLQVSFWDPVSADWRWDVAAVTRAITWAINNDVDIINYSGGGTNDNVARRNAISNFQGLFIAAAGNNGDNNDITRYYPSDYSRERSFSDRVISVGAINNMGNRPNFSNFGSASVSIFAPGVDILSTVPNAINPAEYDSWQGTSMATPHVTGAAALMWSVFTGSNSGWTRAQMASTIKRLIINNAVTDDTGTPLNGLCVANGRLNVFRAVSAVAFTTAPTSGGMSIMGLRPGFSLVNNTSLALPERFDPGTTGVLTVNAIGYNAFENCISISEIYIPSSVTTIGNDAFKNTNNASIFLEGKVIVPSTFSYYWNPSGNPVYLNGNLCTHTFKTTIELNDTQHGDYCFDCRTLTNKMSHRKYTLGEWQYCHDCPYSKFLGHTHNYTYTWLNLQEHKRSCSCGDSRTTPHIISGSWNGQGYTTCLACGGPADSGIILQGIDPTSITEDVNIHIKQYFGNESFILNNGVIVLSELDLVKYYDGTLILPYECD